MEGAIILVLNNLDQISQIPVYKHFELISWNFRFTAGVGKPGQAREAREAVRTAMSTMNPTVIYFIRLSLTNMV